MDEEIELLGAMFDEELAGDDDDDYDLGRRVRSRRGGRSLRSRKANYLRKISPRVPGVPAAGARNFPLGFGNFQFVNAGVTTTTLTARPQRPFKGHRLVVDVARSAALVGGLVLINALNIGQSNQLVSAATLPAEAFGPGAFQTMLSLDPATPGIDITLQISITGVLGVGETVDVSAMLIGDTIG